MIPMPHSTRLMSDISRREFCSRRQWLRLESYWNRERQISPRRGDMFIAQRNLRTSGAVRSGGTQIDSTNLVSFRPSEPRLGIIRCRSINISLLRSEEIGIGEAIYR